MPLPFETIAHDARFLAQLTLAGVTLFGVLLAALASFLAARKGVYVSSITVERSKWIEKLRGNLASYSAELLRCSIQSSMTGQSRKRWLFQQPDMSNDKEFFDRFHRIEELASTIRLQLNPDGRIDAVILFMLDNCGMYFVGRLKDINRFNSLLVRHSQWLLKAEWERVKWEAGGLVYRLLNWGQAGCLRRNYNRYLGAEGDVTTLFSLAIANKIQQEQGLKWITEEQYEELVSKIKPKPPRASWLYRKMLEVSTKKSQQRLKDAFASSSISAAVTEAPLS